VIFEPFCLGCLAPASYLIGSDGVAAVVDPRLGLRIAHIIETHLHADFVSGHRELAERTGATIYPRGDVIFTAEGGEERPIEPCLAEGGTVRREGGQVRFALTQTSGRIPRGTMRKPSVYLVL
jgi:glyoxylase-like metal-dependent hydrolase (beta-lactamase superfamily II)